MINHPNHTKKYLIAITLAAITLAFSPVFSLGDQTGAEKAAAESNNMKRKVKKKAHHVSESMCSAGDATCAGRKIKHRGQEAGEAVGDKAKEGADKIDTDKKVNH